MKAVVMRETGGPEVLELREVETPAPGPEEIQVRVRATALNRADLLQRRGKYPPPPGTREDIPGLEFAGEVSAVGARVTEWKIGDRVMGLLPGEGYAEYIVTHERLALAIPKALSFAQAAAIPEAFLTAFDAVNLQLGLRPGETLLIHAAGSGVGTAARQLAAAIGARVIGTTRSAEKARRLESMGYERCIDTSSEDFAEVVRRELGGADAVLDLVGGSLFAGSIKALKPRGRIIVVGLVGGIKSEIDLAAVLGKRLTIMGTVLRSRPIEEKIALTQAFRREALPLFDNCMLAPIVDATYPMAEASRAHAQMENNANIGKIVLEVGEQG